MPKTTRAGGAVRRRASSIRDEDAYIRNTKERLGDEQQLRAHAERHEPDAANPCERAACGLQLRWELLKVLKGLEAILPVASELREVRAALSQMAAIAKHCQKVLEPVQGRLAQLFDYFVEQEKSFERVQSSVFGNGTPEAVLDPLAEQPLHDFREMATFVLALHGYNYPVVADFVDEGDGDRTRKRPAWLQAEAARAKAGISRRKRRRRRARPPQEASPAAPSESHRADTASAVSPALPGQGAQSGHDVHGRSVT